MEIAGMTIQSPILATGNIKNHNILLPTRNNGLDHADASGTICAKCLVLLISFTSIGTPADQADFIDLGKDVIPSAVSPDGSAVVGRIEHEGFIWSASEGVRRLGFLPGGKYTKPVASSNNGTVVVGEAATHEYSNIRPFRWDASNGMQSLGLLYPDDHFGGATDISADGKTITGFGQKFIGSASEPRGIERIRAFVWEQTTGLQSFGTKAIASTISANGSFISGKNETSFNTVGLPIFRWSEEHGFTTILGIGISHIANDISDDGIVVGECLFATNDHQHPSFTACGIDKSGKYTNLENPIGMDRSSAKGISNDGARIVGFSAYKAFLWEAENGIQDLNQFLPQVLNIDITGWELREASAISGDGKIIAGYGYGPDQELHGWVLDLSDYVFEPLDTDGDTISDEIDNCPTVSNLEQLDTDNDGAGNACDSDDDNDGMSDDEELAVGRNPLVSEPAIIIGIINTLCDF